MEFCYRLFTAVFENAGLVRSLQVCSPFYVHMYDCNALEVLLLGKVAFRLTLPAVQLPKHPSYPGRGGSSEFRADDG